MKYAIIKIGPFQYTVEEGKEYSVPKFEAKEGKFEVKDVLAIGSGDSVKFGKPTLSEKVTLKVLGSEKGEKVTSRIFKAKSRYRRTRGFRKEVTKFVVESIK